MNKIKYISFSLIVLLIGIICISFISINKIYASELYEGGEFDASVTTDNSLLPDYAITDVEIISYVGYTSFKIRIDRSKMTGNFRFFGFSSDVVISGAYDMANISFTDNGILGFKSIKISCSGGAVFNFYPSSDLSHYGLWFLKDVSGFYDLEFISNNMSYLGSISYPINEYFDENINNLCDMSSDTNYNISLMNFSNNNYLYYLYNSCNNNTLKTFFSCSTDFSSFGLRKYNETNFVDYSSTSKNLYEIRCDFYFCLDDFNVNFITKSFKIDIYKPSYRLNNSLIFYCFDYLPFLNNVNAFDCYYRRGSYLYKLMFYDNKIPNSYYSVYFNNEFNNIIFDEYISLVFDLSTLDLNQLIIDNTGVYLSFGFDFNFVQYSQPLVASNGSFNYTFDKPKYVDMKFSLTPFYIPILELVENALIFLMFYCPIISDILEIIHLDLFMGGIINVVNFILGGTVGQFVLSCIAFIIFFELLRRFMPVVYSAKNDILEIYHNSNGYRYRQEKKQAKKEWKYQQYKDKQVAKQVNKLKKMNKKK